MLKSSSLTVEQRLAAVDLFEAGFGHAAISSRLGVSLKAVERLEARFKIWGRAALERKPTKQVYSFEFKLALVRQFLEGEGTQPDLARMHQLSSPKILGKWIQIYREQSEDGLRPEANRNSSTKQHGNICEYIQCDVCDKGGDDTRDDDQVGTHVLESVSSTTLGSTSTAAQSVPPRNSVNRESLRLGLRHLALKATHVSK